MGAIIDAYTSLLTPQVAERIGAQTGTPSNLVTRGLGLVGPLVVGFAAKRAVAPGGLQGLLNHLPAGFESSPTGIESLLKTAKDPRASSGLMHGIFGSGLSATTGTLTRTLGVDASTLLRIGAPLVLGFIAKKMRESKLDEQATAKLLRDEHRSFLARNDEVARSVQEAQVAGDQANAVRERFTPHEWATARLAPIAAAQVVMMAAPSGLVGAVNELASAAKEIKRARGSAVPSSLVGILFDGEITKDEVMALKDKEVALSVVKEGIAAVKANTPSEAKMYSNLLVDIAIKTAEASKEGGVLGFGGTKVSKEEQAAIEAIRLVAG